MNSEHNPFSKGYVDGKERRSRRIVMSDGTGHPDASDAYVIVLDPNDNCNFDSGLNAYTGERLPNPY